MDCIVAEPSRTGVVLSREPTREFQLLEMDMRRVQLENVQLRRTSTIPTTALKSAARILQLEERLAESARRAQDSEIALAEACNAVVRGLESELKELAKDRDFEKERAASLEKALAAAMAQLRHTRQAEQASGIDEGLGCSRLREERASSVRPSCEQVRRSPLLRVTPSTDCFPASPSSSPSTCGPGASSNSDAWGQHKFYEFPAPPCSEHVQGSRSRLSSVRRALRRSKEAVRMSLPRAESQSTPPEAPESP